MEFQLILMHYFFISIGLLTVPRYLSSGNCTYTQRFKLMILSLIRLIAGSYRSDCVKVVIQSENIFKMKAFMDASQLCWHKTSKNLSSYCSFPEFQNFNFFYKKEIIFSPKKSWLTNVPGVNPGIFWLPHIFSL